MLKGNYDNIIADLSNPDKMSEALVRLNDQLAQDETDYNNLKYDRDSLKNSNDTLRDTNAKLALRVTQHVDAIKQTVESERDYFKELTTDIFEKLEGKSNG